jgi:hypothetical protein
MTVDNTGFHFVEKTDFLERGDDSSFSGCDQRTFYETYIFYNPEKEIKRRIVYRNDGMVTKVQDISHTILQILFSKIKNFPELPDTFYFMNMTEEQAKYFILLADFRGIKGYNLEYIKNKKESDFINWPVTKITFFSDAEKAAFIFYFNDYINFLDNLPDQYSSSYRGK